MALPFTDTFTNTNGTALATHDSGWTVDRGAIDIQSNTAQGNASGDLNARWTTDTPNDDQEITGVGSSDGSDGAIFGELNVRAANAGGFDGYGYFGNYNDTTGLERWDNGTFTGLGSFGTDWADTDTIKMDANGTTISGYINGGAADLSQTDATYSSGDCGIGFLGDGVNAQWNSITIDNLVTLAIEQADFRWGDDDGSESAYTFLAAQNVDITRAGDLNTIIRIGLDTIGDSVSSQMKLQVKRSTGTASEWRDVPVA